MITTLYCTDGSDLATRAGRVGRDVLQPASRVVVATVVDVPDETMLAGASGFAGGVMSEREFDESTRRALEAGNEIASSFMRALSLDSAETRVLTGDPADALCALAKEISATTLVVGSRGLGGIKRAFLGSVSDYLVRNAPCPVLVVGE